VRDAAHVLAVLDEVLALARERDELGAGAAVEVDRLAERRARAKVEGVDDAVAGGIAVTGIALAVRPIDCFRRFR